MKKLLAPCIAVLATAISYAAPADDVAAAAKKLADAPNYSWTRTQEVANAPFPSSPTTGMTEKGGYTVTTSAFGDMETVTIRKGEQTVSKGGQDTDFMTQQERMEQFQAAGGPPGGGRGGFGGGFGGGGAQLNPAEDLAALVTQAKNLKVADGAIVGDLAPEGVNARLVAGRGGRAGGEPPPPPTNASGTVKFWLKDGAISKYETHVKGTVMGRGGEVERDVTVTVEIKDVGTTKLTVPEAAKKKLG